jgi:protein TonB
MKRDAKNQGATETSSFDASTGYYAFALEDEADSRRTRYAVAGAVVVHALLFIAPLGFLKPDPLIAAPPPEPVVVLTPIRFEPPELEKQQEIPPPREMQVPIPDPTPDDPEPLRIEEEIAHQIELPDFEILYGIPEAPPPFAPDGAIPVGGDVTPPVKISGPTPQYTEIARRAGIEGLVIVQAIVDRNGNVTNVKIIKPLPMGLDESAADAVSQWKFEPATLNGKPVDVYYNLTVNFRLQR